MNKIKFSSSGKIKVRGSEMQMLQLLYEFFGRIEKKGLK